MIFNSNSDPESNRSRLEQFLARLGVQAPANNDGEPPSLTDERLVRTLRSLPYPCDVTMSGTCHLTVPVAGDRFHRVLATSATYRFGGQEFRKLYACSLFLQEPPSQELANLLLTHNGKLDFGAWYLLPAGEGFLVFLAASVRTNATSRELGQAIESVAELADSMETALTQNDDF